MIKYSILLLICLILVTNFVSATSADAVELVLNVHDNTIEARSVGKFSNINNKDFYFTIINSSGGLCVGCKVNSTSFNWGIVFETSGNVSVDINLLSMYNESQFKLNECNIKATYNQQQWSNYENKYNAVQNLTEYKTKYDSCTLDLRSKDDTISNKNQEITNMEEDKKDTSNLKYFWAIGGAVLGVLAWRFYKGEIGKGRVRDKEEEDFNRRQAG